MSACDCRGNSDATVTRYADAVAILGLSAANFAIAIAVIPCSFTNHCSRPAVLAADAATLLCAYLAARWGDDVARCGEFEVTSRFRKVVNKFVKNFCIKLLLAVAVSSFAVLTLRTSTVSALAILSLVQGYGMLMLAGFLGQGLVIVPRTLWLQACPEARLDALAFALATVDAEYRSAAKALASAVTSSTVAVVAARGATDSAALEGRVQIDELQRAKIGFEVVSSFVEYIRDTTVLPPDSSQGVIGFIRSASDSMGIGTVVTESSAVREHSRLRHLLIVERGLRLQKRKLEDKSLGLRRALLRMEPGFGGTPVPSRRGLWLGAMRKWCWRGAAVICAAVSITIVLSEACQLGADFVPLRLRKCPTNAIAIHFGRLASSLIYVYIVVAIWWSFGVSKVLANKLVFYEPREWDGASGVALLAHSAWLLRLSMPVGNHAALLVSSPTNQSPSHEQAYQFVCCVLTIFFCFLTVRGRVRWLGLFGFPPAEAYQFEKAQRRPQTVETGLQLLDQQLKCGRAEAGCWPRESEPVSALAGESAARWASLRRNQFLGD